MLFYYLILFIFSVFALLEVLGLKKEQAQKIYIFLSVFLFILSFIRWETGSDWENYYDFFIHAPDWGEFREFEPLFATLNTLTYYIGGNYTSLLFILSAILFLFQTKSISLYSLYPITSLYILMGISFGNVFYIRQTIATCILFYATKYIEEKKLLQFLFLIIIATLLHRSSIIFIFAWWIYNLNLKKKTIIYTVIASLFASALAAYILNFMGQLIGGVISYKLNEYMGESDSTGGSAHSYILLVVKGVINKCFVLFLALYLIDKVKEKYPAFRSYTNLYWFGTILYFATMGISIILVRFSFPYDIFQIIILPFAFSFLQRKSNKVFFFIILSFYLYIRMYMYFSSYKELYVPFKTIFSL